MADALAQAKLAAEMDDGPILLLGETGVGKTQHAGQIHKWTGRGGAFVVVDCCSIPAGLMESRLFGHVRGAFTGAVSDSTGAFQLANGGTVFLDEIGDLPLDMQAKLLRVTQDGKFCKVGNAKELSSDVRIIAATHRDLRAEVKAGRFRQDLFERLNVFPIFIPPLRERRSEIPGIIKAACKEKGWVLNERVAEVFEFADWPGNVRELLAHVKRAAVFGWDHHRAAQEVYRPDTKAAPGAGRLGRLAVARDLSAQGWWSVAEMALACAVSKATICRDLLEWAETGEIESRGEGCARRHRLASQDSHANVENVNAGTVAEGEVAK
jgi:transcriptional regulator with GAF, ATPase, and Fis domain